jgi:hypothetical protein
MKLTSYWLDTSQPFDRGSSKPLEGRYDVAVVGGGRTGSSAALRPRQEGRPGRRSRGRDGLAGDPRVLRGSLVLPILGAYYRMKDLVT